MTMRLRVPTITFVPISASYAPRPQTLAGKRVGFLDGWGDQRGGKVVGMYPAMAEIERYVVEQCGVAETVWQMKPTISNEVPHTMLREFADRVDVVVNGEGL